MMSRGPLQTQRESGDAVTQSVREKMRGTNTGSFAEETGYVTQHQIISISCHPIFSLKNISVYLI